MNDLDVLEVVRKGADAAVARTGAASEGLRTGERSAQRRFVRSRLERTKLLTANSVAFNQLSKPRSALAVPFSYPELNSSLLNFSITSL